jgi:hypothetical protein
MDRSEISLPNQSLSSPNQSLQKVSTERTPSRTSIDSYNSYISPCDSRNNSVDGNGDEDSDNKYIRILINDIDNLSISHTILQANATTTASEIIESIANKIKISSEDLKHYSLVLVYTRFNEKGSSSKSPNSKYQIVKSLKSNDILLNVLENIINKQTIKYQKKIRNSNLISPLSNKNFSKWYFKDKRRIPLDLDETGDVSGNSSSEEEDEISLNDFTYLTQGERRGYLLKRSRTDPNLWRRRYCILTDKLWYFDVKRQVNPRGQCIQINSSAVVRDKVRLLDYPNAIIITTMSDTHYFRATSPLEQHSWINDISQRARLSSDNDVIKMAEMIINDEELANWQRVERRISNILDVEGVVSTFLCNEEKIINLDSKSKSDRTLLSPRSLSSPLPSSNSLIDNNNNNNNNNNKLLDTDNIKSPFSLESQEIFQRLIHRDIKKKSIIHNLHKNEPDLSNALSFSTSVYRYKELFRHDLFATPKQQWISAMNIYQQFLLPRLSKISFKTNDSDNNINDLEINDDIDVKNLLKWDISKDSLTKIHIAIFSNIRRNIVDTQIKKNKKKVENNSGFWSWGTSNNETNIKQENDVSNEEDEYFSLPNNSLVFQILDLTYKPSSILFDNLVNEMFDSLNRNSSKDLEKP